MVEPYLTHCPLCGRPAIDQRTDETGHYRLVGEQATTDHAGHRIDVRFYPDLDPPATFVDCRTCLLTWEMGR